MTYDLFQFMPLQWMLLLPTLFLFFALFAMSIQLAVITKTDRKQISCALELFLQDRYTSSSLLLIFLYTLGSYLLFAFFSAYSSWSGYILGIWCLTTLFLFEVLRRLIKRLYKFHDMQFLLSIVKRRFIHDLGKGNEQGALMWINTIIETVLHAGENGNLARVGRILDTIHDLLNIYVQKTSLTEVLASVRSEHASVFVQFNALCVYVCKRLEWVFCSMLDKGIEPIAEEVLASFGKLGLFCLRQHPSLGGVPFSFIGKSALKAYQKGYDDVVVRAIVTLSEACKMCLALSKEKNISYKDIILSLLLDIETLLKAQYKQEGANIPLLMQPFAEIGQLLAGSEYQNIPDKELILQELKRLLAQFQALELVIQNVEMPQQAQDATSSF